MVTESKHDRSLPSEHTAVLVAVASSSDVPTGSEMQARTGVSQRWIFQQSSR